ncbi:MAG: carbonic anhydrase family protein [Gammaproteobacteria bacterium]|nr:carbonic anhydrase family protein [Gammaproteobacteria bacterium]
MFTKKLIALGISALLSIAVTGCSSTTNSTSDTAAGHTTNTTPHFTYGAADSTGPQHWGTLSTDWATCSNGNALSNDFTGNHQSPINFAGTSAAVTLGLSIGGAGQLEFIRENNGHTIELKEEDAANSATITINSITYTLLQFHFHANSEHQDHGQYAPMEVHFVFANTSDPAATKYAVVGGFIDQGTSSNSELAKALAAALPADGVIETTPIAISVANIISDGSAAYRYNGSFTTPPCTEGVEWTVLSQHLTLSAADIKTFTDHYSNNFRPLTGTLN